MVLASNLTDAVLMEFPCRFHVVFILVACSLYQHRDPFQNYMEPAWNLHGTSIKTPSVRTQHTTTTPKYRDFRNLHGRCTETPWNLHGTSMEPPSNLHQSDKTRQPPNTGNSFKTYLKTPSNIHQNSMKPTCNRHEFEEITCRIS